MDFLENSHKEKKDLPDKLILIQKELNALKVYLHSETPLSTSTQKQIWTNYHTLIITEQIMANGHLQGS